MKKLLVLIVVLLAGCGINEPCHTCKGLSESYQSRQKDKLLNHSISYETYLKRLAEARSCKETVCDGNDYCSTHR